jgi:hypothetical protein
LSVEQRDGRVVLDASAGPDAEAILEELPATSAGVSTPLVSPRMGAVDNPLENRASSRIAERGSSIESVSHRSP